MLTAPDRPGNWPNPNDLATLEPGHDNRPEPHPWGAPLPGFRPPSRWRAFGQWLAYAIALTLAVVLVVIATLHGHALANPAPTVPTIGGTHAARAVVVDTFQTEGTSHYHGPSHPSSEPVQQVGP